MEEADNEAGSQRDAVGSERGRLATAPWRISRRGWWDILLRVKNQSSDDALGIAAAAVAFYALLSVFPALVALVSIYGLITDPAQVQQQLAAVSGVVPPGARELLMSQLQSLTAGGGTTVTAGLIASTLFTLWTASKAMGALITCLNIVYEEKETRGLIKPYLISLVLTFGAILFVIAALFLIVAIPPVLAGLGLPFLVEIAARVVQWLLLALAVMAALGVVYRYAPSRRRPQWQWVSVGAIAGAVLWLVGSALFSIYIENFGNYNKVYGSFAAIIILMLWFNLSAYATLLGAEINAEMEHQTSKDTTVGRPRIRGNRGAYVADHLGGGDP